MYEGKKSDQWSELHLKYHEKVLRESGLTKVRKYETKVIWYKSEVVWKKSEIVWKTSEVVMKVKQKINPE